MKIMIGIIILSVMMNIVMMVLCFGFYVRLKDVERRIQFIYKNLKVPKYIEGSKIHESTAKENNAVRLERSREFRRG